MRLLTRTLAALTGALFALIPLVASAAEEGRVLERGDDWSRVMIVTLATLLGVMLLATLGYLYRVRRDIVWDFQRSEAPHDDHH